MRPHPQKVARYCKETAKERSRRPRGAVSVFMDGTGELSLMWALFGERCLRLCNRVCRFIMDVGVLKVAHKFCGPVFQSGYVLSVIQLWHLVAFKLNFCMSCFFICGCVQSLYKSLTLDELAALLTTGFVDLLVAYY